MNPKTFAKAVTRMRVAYQCDPFRGGNPYQIHQSVFGVQNRIHAAAKTWGVADPERGAK